MQNNSSNFVELISSFLPIISLICTWKIFADRGEAGWKAIIPFYSFLIFGRIAGDENKAVKLIVASILSLVCFTIFCTALVFSLSHTYSGSAAGIFLILSGIGTAVSTIFAFLYGILLKVRFVEKEQDPGWIALLWVLFPIAGDLYYAFLKR